ncbi:MAG: hypothetical protein PHI31_11430 [Desulfuromonadaceae bacterium]|nr:hypothetical protein [Desulfuromonadaceae bacterium]
MEPIHAGWNRQTNAGHLRQVGPFAAEQVFHLSHTLSLAVAKKIYAHCAFPIVARRLPALINLILSSCRSSFTCPPYRLFL